VPPNILDSVRAPDITDVFEPVGPQTLQFRHRTISGISAEADNIIFPYYWTRLAHSALNGRPNAILTVTPVGRIEVDGTTARLVHNPHPVGVLYRDVDDRWYIYNLGLEAMSIRADFQVAIHEATRDE
jgi:hypothetical protein